MVTVLGFEVFFITKIVGLCKLEKYVLPFFSRTVVTKEICVGSPKRYYIIFPVLVSILIPPAIFLIIEIILVVNISGKYIKNFLMSGRLFKRSEESSLTMGMAINNSPF